MAAGFVNDQRSLMLFGIPLFLAILVGSLGLTGCGEKGIPRYDLSGEATFKGQPVPNGFVNFRPDRDQGNPGPGSSAVIVAGRYHTEPGQGTIGGPHIVTVFGTDGVPYKDPEGFDIPIGRPLFPEFEVHIDIPKETATHNFEVPSE